MLTYGCGRVHVCVYVYVHICMAVCMCVDSRVYLYIIYVVSLNCMICLCVWVCVCMYICACIQASICAHSGVYLGCYPKHRLTQVQGRIEVRSLVDLMRWSRIQSSHLYLHLPHFRCMAQTRARFGSLRAPQDRALRSCVPIGMSCLLTRPFYFGVFDVTLRD